MAIVTVTINTGNAAFDEYPETEVARLLRESADALEVYGIPNDESETRDVNQHVLRDVNGNRVGRINITV